MKMQEPARTGELQGRVKVDNLVAHNHFEHEALHGRAFWLVLFVVGPPAPLFLGGVVLECCNPRMDCTLQACEKDRLNFGVQLPHPKVQVDVLLKVQLINS